MMVIGDHDPYGGWFFKPGGDWLQRPVMLW